MPLVKTAKDLLIEEIHGLKGNQARIALLHVLSRASDNVDFRRVKFSVEISKSYTPDSELYSF